MTTAEKLAALVDARERIADPARWTQRSYARDKEGWPEYPTAPGAARWCAAGSLARSLGVNPMVKRDDVADWVGLCGYVTGATTTLPLICINDGKRGMGDRVGHAAVLALFDAAIGRLQAEVAL